MKQNFYNMVRYAAVCQKKQRSISFIPVVLPCALVIGLLLLVASGGVGSTAAASRQSQPDIPALEQGYTPVFPPPPGDLPDPEAWLRQHRQPDSSLPLSRPAEAQAITPNPQIQLMIDQVDSATLADYVKTLSGEQPATIGGSSYTMSTRYTLALQPILHATQYVYERLQSLGLAVQYQSYNVPGSGSRRNVIAEQPGQGSQACIYLITAHVDDTSKSNPAVLAPGADDNASGVAAVLTAADILHNYSFACTVRYVVFTGEEQGLYGSAAYAAAVKSNQDPILGVLNLDMVAYNSDTHPYLSLHTRKGNAQDLSLADLFSGVIGAYRLDLSAQIIDDNDENSDHASFWEQGYAAIMAIEDDNDFTPYYHSDKDRFDTLNLAYFTEFAKTALGSVAHLAGPLDKCVAAQPANFSFTPALPQTGQTVVFTASVPTSSTLPVQYAWDFGDGSNGGGMVVTHTFASMGQYSILLTTSNCGGQVSVTHPLQVSGVPGIDVQPVSLQTTLSPGGEQGQPLVISNTGTAPLVWNLTEKPAVSWLSETITQGDVNPGGSVGVTLGFVAPRTQGVYTTSLLISSNDVQQPQVRLPVTLTIYPRQIFLPVISRR